MKAPALCVYAGRGRHALAAAGIIAATLVWAARRASLDVHQAAAATTTEQRAASWCAIGFTELPGNGCLAMPETFDPPLPLVIYLHGLYDADHPEKEIDRQARLAARATERGYAVLALRSNKGACHPSPEASTQYCWPSNERVADRAPDIVESWSEALREAERRTGDGGRYVVGFSSGGFFAGLLAVRSLFRADAFVIAHAGPVEPVWAGTEPPPLLLLSANDDPSVQGMRQLDEELTSAGWPHEYAARNGGHELTDGDIDTALAFLDRVETGRLVP